MSLLLSLRAQWTGMVPRRVMRRVTVCFLSLILLLTLRGNLHATSTAEEYSVKAAFLFHFAQFIDWPEKTFKDAISPLTYCTVGNDPFHGALDASLSGKTIGARPFRVLHFKQPAEIRGCQILFIGVGGKRLFPAVLASLKENSVLTVGESEHFAQNGGMIGFLLEENRIRFEINLEAAEHARLKMSSRLLALAKTVIGGHRGT